VGEACNGPSQCCSNACIEIVGGASFCAPIGGCRPIGELCSDDVDCCTDNCTLQGGVMLCGLPPNCRPPGEICDPSFGECCPGVEREIGHERLLVRQQRRVLFRPVRWR
jgi:hypothetical protein